MLSDARNLYQRIIIDHANHPRHYGEIADGMVQTIRNPSCGDTINVFVQIQDARIQKLSFTGTGCIISQASASMMTDILINRSIDEAELMIQRFQHLIMGDNVEVDILSDAVAFKSLSAFPTRVRCGALAWHAILMTIKKWRNQNVR